MHESAHCNSVEFRLYPTLQLETHLMLSCDTNLEDSFLHDETHRLLRLNGNDEPQPITH